MNINSIPVLTYHSIRPGETIDPDLLDLHFRTLAASGMESLLPEALDRAAEGFMITFDDGFADFFQQVFPLLKKHRLKATVFVIARYMGGGPVRAGSEFPDISAVDAHNQAAIHSPHPAFLQWEELKEMESSGHVRVHSHSYSHAMGWVADRIRGFHLPPATHTAWFIAQVTGGDTRPGIPVFKRGSLLASRRFYEHQQLKDQLAEWVIENGGPEYIRHHDRSAIERRLFNIVDRYKKEHGTLGRWETEKERYDRTMGEIQRARKLLERHLGGVRDELCLPWGEYDDITIECARSAGIRRLYTLDRSPNPVGNVGALVNRFEPRARGAKWLKSRMWIYRSAFRTRLYKLISRR